MIGMRLEGFRQEGAMVSCAVDLDCCGHNGGFVGLAREGKERKRQGQKSQFGRV